MRNEEESTEELQADLQPLQHAFTLAAPAPARSELFSLLVPMKVAVNIALHLPGLGSKRRLESESKAGRLEPSPARRLEPREAGARATEAGRE